MLLLEKMIVYVWWWCGGIDVSDNDEWSNDIKSMEGVRRPGFSFLATYTIR